MVVTGCLQADFSTVCLVIGGWGGGRDKLVYPFEGTGDNLYAYVVGNSWSLHLLEKQSLLFFQAPSALEHPKVLT